MTTPSFATVEDVVPVVEVGVGQTYGDDNAGRWDLAHWAGPVAWTDILLEPFDNLAAWTPQSTTPTIVAGRTGTAVQCVSNGRVDYTIPAASESDTVTIGFAYRATVVTTAQRPMVALYSDTNTVQHVSLRHEGSDGRLRAYMGASTVLGASATGTIVANTWQYVEMRAKVHDTAGSVVVRVDGVEVINFTGDTRNAGTKTTFDTVRLGAPSISNTSQYDDLALTVGTGAPFRGGIAIPPATARPSGTAGTDVWSGAEPLWVDITCDVRAVDSTVGHDRSLDAWDVGTCTVTVDNASGWADLVLDPLDADELSLRPGRAIRWGVRDLITGATTWRFRGFIDAMRAEYAGQLADTDTAVLDCIDALGEVARVRLGKTGAPVGAGETATARIDRILDAAGWRDEWRDLESSSTVMLGTDLDAQTADLLSQTADTVGGALFGDYLGRVAFRNRDWQTYMPGTPPDLVIGNVGGAAPCPSTIEVAFPRAGTTSRALTNYEGATTPPQQYDDEAAQRLYGVETTPERLDLQTDNTVHLAGLAKRLVETRGAATMPRVNGLTLDAGRDRATMLAMLAADPQRPSRWRLVVDRAGRPLLDRMLFVTAVSHSWDASGWRASVRLDDAEPWEAAGGRWDGAYWDRSLWSAGLTELRAEAEQLLEALEAAP